MNVVRHDAVAIEAEYASVAVMKSISNELRHSVVVQPGRPGLCSMQDIFKLHKPLTMKFSKPFRMCPYLG
jgi:hypothetical protein